jgi:hypothetical protein
MGDMMETLISYRTPGDLFNPGKRPPGHVLDPIIRSAARTASETLQELGVQHRTEYIDGRDGRDGRDGPGETGQFYGALIILAGPGQESVPIPYGWALEGAAQDGETPRWKNLHACRAGCSQDPGENPGQDCPAAASAVRTVVRTWKEIGLVSTQGAGGEPA